MDEAEEMAKEQKRGDRIADLEEKVQNLEKVVEEQTETVAQQQKMIADQRKVFTAMKEKIAESLSAIKTKEEFEYIKEKIQETLIDLLEHHKNQVEPWVEEAKEAAQSKTQILWTSAGGAAIGGVLFMMVVTMSLGGLAQILPEWTRGMRLTEEELKKVEQAEAVEEAEDGMSPAELREFQMLFKKGMSSSQN
jgi:uncharacterized coiled-coil protein SlyX